MNGLAPTSDPSGLDRSSLETARAHAEPSVPYANAHDSAAEVRARLRQQAYQNIDIVIVVNADGTYAGAIPTGSILRAPDELSMHDLSGPPWPSVPSDIDQERAVELAATAEVTSLPVLDAARRPIGCIPPAALIRIAATEHREDVHRMAGIIRESTNSIHALEDPPLQRFARRLPWLLVGLALSTAGTATMAGFEATLQKQIAVAYFIPALVYLTDAIGTQTEAIAVRGLAVATRPFSELLLAEFTTGSMLGGALGTVATLAIWAIFGDCRLAAGVGLTLLVAGAVASSIGLGLPWVLGRFGVDPALGSGPVATIVQDVLTLLVYFGIVTTLMTFF